MLRQPVEDRRSACRSPVPRTENGLRASVIISSAVKKLMKGVPIARAFFNARSIGAIQMLVIASGCGSGESRGALSAVSSYACVLRLNVVRTVLLESQFRWQ